MDPQSYLRDVDRAAEFIRSKAPWERVETALILGSGIGEAAPDLERAVTVPYEQIPGFPRPTVSGHKGNLVLGIRRGKGVAVLQGRFHYYEGHEMASVALPLRALHRLGLNTLVVTAAVGSLTASLKPGHLLILKDHINLMGSNPLRGFHTKEFGTMFPDMVGAYDPRLRQLALKACKKRRARCSEGVYVAVSGPSYETPAEILAFRMMGGDVVGMSIVPETVVARQLGIRVLGVAWVSNLGAGLSKEILAHTSVLIMGKQSASHIKGVLEQLLPSLL